MAKWLVKTEPEVFSIADLKRERATSWGGVRNYQARNFLRAMKVGEEVLIYHSNTEPPAVVGVAAVKRAAYPDPEQFDRHSEYFDGKSTQENPRWFSPDLMFVKEFPTPVELARLKAERKLKAMPLLQRGSRLSVMPVTADEFKYILRLAGA
ncbi:MAG: EVE domain-containing protein [Oligoflexia bacterium]|nr:EVE domain-containing protein [Oligoflexia bacterium]